MSEMEMKKLTLISKMNARNAKLDARIKKKALWKKKNFGSGD